MLATRLCTRSLPTKLSLVNASKQRVFHSGLFFYFFVLSTLTFFISFSFLFFFLFPLFFLWKKLFYVKEKNESNQILFISLFFSFHPLGKVLKDAAATTASRII